MLPTGCTSQQQGMADLAGCTCEHQGLAVDRDKGGCGAIDNAHIIAGAGCVGTQLGDVARDLGNGGLVGPVAVGALIGLIQEAPDHASLVGFNSSNLCMQRSHVTK